MLTSLVALQQGNIKKKKKKKLVTIVNIEVEVKHLLNELINFNEIFEKNVTYDNIKSYKISGLHLSLENTFCEKPAFLGLTILQ